MHEVTWADFTFLGGMMFFVLYAFLWLVAEGMKNHK